MIKQVLWIILYFILFILLLIIIMLLITTPFKYIKCNNIYTDTQYKIIWWCMVKYNWKYISEDLYIKSFDQNLFIK